MLRQILNEILDAAIIWFFISTAVLASLPAMEHEANLRQWQTLRCISPAPDRAIVDSTMTAETRRGLTLK